MTTRAHLSIGEVLSLLQDEFPDITISKIRFLESQGLLDPERTPSGYRKFYEKDIERLRWILVQQRENFLPLKVIKDRLVSGELDEPTLDFTGTADEPPPGDPGTEPAADPDDQVGANGVADTVDAPPDGGATQVPTSTSASTSAEAVDVLDETVVVHEEVVVHEVVEVTETPSPRKRARSRKRSGSTEPTPASTDGGAEPVPSTGADGSEAATPSPTDESTATPSGSAEPSAAELGASVLDGGESSVSLTLDELIAATGLTSRQVGELERYGLVTGKNLGSATSYDEDALVVARLSRSFMAHGVEPRHIRAYKVAAEREVSVFEQLVLPVLKQRDPAARQEALESLRELAGLGEQIRGALLRQALREYLGSS